MASEDPRASAPSLLGVTVRRSLVVGRIYLFVGVFPSLAYSVALAAISPAAFESAIPVLLPIFGALGGMGGMMVFVIDRQKGVLEYLLAYGYTPRQLFATVVLAGLAVLTVVLLAAVALSLAVFVGTGHAVPLTLVALFALYTVPMSYASAAFATVTGMYWTSLSAPRAGTNGPIGLVPLVGVAPSLITLVLIGVAPAHAVAILAASLVLLTGVILALVGLVGSLLPPERLLSPV